MNPVSSESLFHFTKSKEAFWGILQNLPRYSFSVEPLPGGAFLSESDTMGEFFNTLCGYNYQIIPMICFCDIPLTRAHVHADKYGEYVFGFDKSTLVKLTSSLGWSSLNPLFYYNEKDAKHLITKVFNHLNAIDCKDREYISRFFGLFKPITEKIGDKVFRYYEEREWRLILNDNSDGAKHWVGPIKNREDALIEAEALNAELHSKAFASVINLNIPKPPSQIIKDLITHIIVKNESEIPEVISKITDISYQLFRFKNIDTDTRGILASKVTSMERIRKDF